MAQQEWDEYGKPITHGSTGTVQEWDEHGTPISGGGTAGNAQGKMGPPAPSESLYSRALSKVGVDPDNPLARGAGEFASTVAHAPSAIYHSFKDPLTPEEEADFQGHTRIPGEVTLERLTGARQIVKGARDWLNPQTRPTWDQVKYIAPEAVGSGAGNYVAGELMGKVTQDTAANIANTARMVPAIKDAMGAASRSIERKLAIDEGMKRVYETDVVRPLQKYKGKVSAEVDKHAQTVNAYDEANNFVKNGSTKIGDVDLTEALNEGTEVMDKVGANNPKLEKLRQQLGLGKGTFNDVKNLMTQVGQEASNARYTKMPYAATLWTIYGKLADAMESHIEDNLGGPSGQAMKSYKQYKTVHKALMEQSGLIDDLMGGATPQEGMGSVVDAIHDTRPGGKGRQNEIYGSNGLAKSMKLYGEDPKTLANAADQGLTLRELTQREQNLFVSKVKAIYNHPALVGIPAVATGAFAGKALGPIGHVVAPLLIAGKMSKMLDNIGMAKLLRDINAKYPAESGTPFKTSMPGPQDIGAQPIAPPGQRPPAPGGPAPAPAPGQAPTPQAGGGGGAPATPQGGGTPQPAQPMPKSTGTTKGDVEDMQEAQIAEDERQIMAKKLSRAKRAKGASGTPPKGVP